MCSTRYVRAYVALIVPINMFVSSLVLLPPMCIGILLMTEVLIFLYWLTGSPELRVRLLLSPVQ